MEAAFSGDYLRQTSCVLYLAVDPFIPVRGKPFDGLDEFNARLDHAGVPAVWVTSRTRLLMDEPRRKNGHTHPFIGEGGCAVYLPEDYFHLKPEKTLRLGRFTSMPVAQPQPAAQEALASLAEDTGVEAVPLRSLSPRELVQNSGLPARDAEMARQRDFDELFFFAGATDEDIQRFVAEANVRKLALRQHGVLWSLAVGASLQKCVRDLTKLYDRALRYHAVVLGVATAEEAPDLFPCCERNILLANDSEEHAADDQEFAEEIDDETAHESDDAAGEDVETASEEIAAHELHQKPARKKTPAKDPKLGSYSLAIPFHAPETWDRLLETVGSRTYK
jgi:predicted mannosyl-3-phosphoglycerate phosphatase (HAD superfamily)